MDDLLANIAAQRAEIAIKILDLQSTLDELYGDMSRLDKAEAAIRGQSLTGFKNLKPERAKREAAPEPYRSIKQMVRLVLTDFPDGLIALDILSKINERFGKSFPRTSLSPQLSRLKQSGDIYKDGKRWVLAGSNHREGDM
ncbi:hypothetical protein GCM10007853_06280 [Algimonas ampicilliniresistens]|uniref:HTH HARE-type domain-containing protein n=1 Tax=Algimonas ampicilliniresistens TaxID=1298735 RepID=A0ABQ5V7Q4_9PROT|nr:hypothetical protein [Algimonas ampicilliniresistens]GLQ22754.1 hypothetical protein GCM10007853_06280 [Algimonas ampicilliniresistens]